jgi:hypothetical protein
MERGLPRYATLRQPDSSGYYAIADGIREVYARSPRRSAPPLEDIPQLAFGFP